MSIISEYMRVKARLADEIQQGKYPVGSRLPTEREMCELFGVSRITVRQALAELENDGLIERVQGRGTFVRKPSESGQRPRKIEQLLSSMYSFSEELRKQNITPSTRVLSLTHMLAQPPLTRFLQIEPGHMVDVVLRLRLADDTPYAYETSYIPSEYLNGATAEEIARNGLYNTMKEKSGVKPDKAMETFEAAIAPEVICEALGRKGVLGIMQLERTSYFQNRVIEYCTCAIAGDKYRFRVTLE